MDNKTSVRFLRYTETFDQKADDISLLLDFASQQGISIRPNYKADKDGKMPYIVVSLNRQTMESCKNRHEIFATAIRQVRKVYEWHLGLSFFL